MLREGRVINPFPHLQASLPCVKDYDPDIIHFITITLKVHVYFSNLYYMMLTQEKTWRMCYTHPAGHAGITLRQRSSDMRLRNIPGSRQAMEESRFVITGPDGAARAAADKSSGQPLGALVCGTYWSGRGRWAEIFGNSNPVRVEIGMGKGAFIMEQARLNPDINFVGIEKYSSVLVRAVEKQNKQELSNVLFVRMEAEYIEDVFAPGEVERIYLNFSDPWPKEKNAKRRLTSGNFLKRYEVILKEGGTVEFKTDNTALFDYSLEEAAEEGWILLASTRDLHNSAMNEGNVMTEYEERFSAMGNHICKFVIMRPQPA